MNRRERDMALALAANLETSPRVPGNPHCPHCGAERDGATSTSRTGRDTPIAGDLAVCITCAGVAEYTADLELVAYDVATLDPVLRDAIECAQRLVKAAGGWEKAAREREAGAGASAASPSTGKTGPS